MTPTAATGRPKNHFWPPSAADRLNEILTLPLAQSVRQVQLYVLSGGRAWCGRIFLTGDGGDPSLVAQRMSNRLATGLRSDCPSHADAVREFPLVLLQRVGTSYRKQNDGPSQVDRCSFVAHTEKVVI